MTEIPMNQAERLAALYPAWKAGRNRGAARVASLVKEQCPDSSSSEKAKLVADIRLRLDGASVIHKETTDMTRKKQKTLPLFNNFGTKVEMAVGQTLRTKSHKDGAWKPLGTVERFDEEVRGGKKVTVVWYGGMGVRKSIQVPGMSPHRYCVEPPASPLGVSAISVASPWTIPDMALKQLLLQVEEADQKWWKEIHQSVANSKDQRTMKASLQPALTKLNKLMSKLSLVGVPSFE